ncbi:hypothetical protein D3C78_1934870 [compost metagenome]
MVKSIILEEEGHLEEMIDQLAQFSPQWEQYANNVQTIERALHTEWISAIESQLN